MIATLQGLVSEIIANETVLSVNGVGYGVTLPQNTTNRMRIDETVKLYIYEHIKEDAHTLYGFVSLADKHLFEQLLQVKNVGPKVAMSILDIGSSSTVKNAIANGDVKQLQTAKGVGRRAAEQIVVELRDKMGRAVGVEAEDIVNRAAADLDDEALQALVALGYSEADAAAALNNVDSNLPIEDRIRHALMGRK